MSEKVSLKANGKIYAGWKDVDVKRSLKAASGGFSLSITDKWSGQSAPWILADGDECELFLGDDKVISGFVDSVNPSMEKSGRAISVSGRDKTADIVDCSVETKKGEYANITLKKLAETLCAPFGITVIAPPSTGAAFDVIKVQQGETVFETLERAAKKRGYLLTSGTGGTLVIMRPGTERTATRLQQGENILSGGASFDGKSRYSKYVVKGQEGSFSHEQDPVFAYAIKATATDPSVKRYRPLVIQSEQLTNLADAKLRANWEAAVRAARSQKFTITVRGWRQSDGSLWRPNLLVTCVAPWIGLNGELLITDVAYKLSSEAGTTCTLNLERKDAYLPEPVVPEKADPLLQAIKKDPGFKK